MFRMDVAATGGFANLRDKIVVIRLGFVVLL